MTRTCYRWSKGRLRRVVAETQRSGVWTTNNPVNWTLYIYPPPFRIARMRRWRRRIGRTRP